METSFRPDGAHRSGEFRGRAAGWAAVLVLAASTLALLGCDDSDGVREPEALGAPCSEDAACRSGLCTEEVCSTCATDEDCPEGYCALGDAVGYHLCVTPDGAALGQPCESEEACASGFCAAGVCSTCATDEDCAGLARCERDGALGYHRCRTSAGRILGEPCSDGTDCASSRCFTLEEGLPVCSLCEAGAGDCPADQACTYDAGRGYALCLAEDLAELGEPCATGDECRSGRCRLGACSECETAAAHCEDREVCEHDDRGYSTCQPLPPGSLGDACGAGSECDSAYCFALEDGGGVCSTCSEEGGCIAGQGCLHDDALGWATCRGLGELGTSCTGGEQCISGFCHSSVCSLCESSDDCHLGLSCEWKEPESYAICLDPAEERVNADLSADGVFERIGCNSDCNGCVCDADADGSADGVCVGEECVRPTASEPSPTVTLDCGVDTCGPEDRDAEAFTTCDGHAGLACLHADDVADDDAFFPQTGLCLCFTPDFCMCQMGGSGDYLCLHEGTYLHQTDCAEGYPCDDSFDGSFDPAYGVASAEGLCAPAVCTEELVDIDDDGSFRQCGCAHNSQGVICDLAGDGTTFGLCAGDECVTVPPISRPCSGERCDGRVELGCAAGGHACDSDFLEPGQSAFEHDGFCALEGSALACVTTGHVCLAGDGSYHASCAACADGDPCDDTLDDGAFDPSAGRCSAGVCEPLVIPASFDWRDNGGDWTTPVANQGLLGACSVFGAIGAIEARWNIQNGDPTLDIDLAEQDPVSCGGWSTFAHLGPRFTLDFARDTGISTESCFPWTGDETTPCDARCSGYEHELWSITASSPVDDYRDVARTVLMEQGPLVATMYAGGMTRGADGLYRCPVDTGGHAVVVVGWDDPGGYWILKNSWGSDWNGAEAGFFRLAYGECQLSIERSIDAVTPP